MKNKPSDDFAGKNPPGKRFPRTILFTFCFLTALATYGLFIEPFNVRIVRVQVSDEKLAGFFDQYKTIMLSDIHASRLGIREQMIVSKINEIDPDLVLLVGDYVSWDGDYDKAIGFLSMIRANEGVYAVMGDSDYQDSRQSCRFCHSFGPKQEGLPIRFLRNERVIFYTENGKITLSGVEMFHKNWQSNLNFFLEASDCPEIVLSHRQMDSDSMPSDRQVLILSGDTHGGQSFIPQFVWQRFFGTLKGNLRKGYLQEDNVELIVSAGIGTSKIPFRFLCPPEIILFE